MNRRPRRRLATTLGETVYAEADPAALAAYRRDAEAGHHVARFLRAVALACRIRPVGHA